MMRILCSDWLPELARWAHFAFLALVPQENVLFWPFNKSKLVWSRWLNMGRVLFCGFIDLDSVHKNSKDNLANIQLS